MRVSYNKKKIHIRMHPDAAGTFPVLCGLVNVASISEAFGYWGPGGDGHKEVCKMCLKRKERKKR